MGLAATQMRFLALTAKKSNSEYQGQQINQQRLNLANQSSNIYTTLADLTVPVPPTPGAVASGIISVTSQSFQNLIDHDVIRHLMGHCREDIINNPVINSHSDIKGIFDYDIEAAKDIGDITSEEYDKFRDLWEEKFQTVGSGYNEPNASSAEVYNDFMLAAFGNAFISAEDLVNTSDYNQLFDNFAANPTNYGLSYDVLYAQYEVELAQYNTQMTQLEAESSNVQQKDKKLELQLKRIDTEHSAIQTEVDAIKKVLDDNIESSFKTFA